MMPNQHNDNFNILQQERHAGVTASRPVISMERIEAQAFKNICPQHAIGVNPDRIDLGKCNFCRTCELAFPDKIAFTEDQALATNVRDRLIVIEGDAYSIGIDPAIVREAIKSNKGKEISFYPVNDIPFVNPRALDGGISFSTRAFECAGLLLTGSIANLSNEELTNIYSQLRDPKIIVVAGIQAISAISGNSTLTEFFKNHTIDLYVPGAPANPEIIGRGIAELIKS